jgi:hypothetical protein
MLVNAIGTVTKRSLRAAMSMYGFASAGPRTLSNCLRK